MTTRAARQATKARSGRSFRLLLITLLLFAACYAGGPFLTLWRISRALDSGNLATLQSLVDWTAVRQGLKDDIAEGVIGMPQRTLLASNTLPPFGASFISGIAGTEIDRAVTPEGLLQAARLLDPPLYRSVWHRGAGSAARPRFPVAIVKAGFSTPAQFDLDLRAPCQDAEEEPLHVRLGFLDRGLAGGARLDPAGPDGPRVVTHLRGATGRGAIRGRGAAGPDTCPWVMPSPPPRCGSAEECPAGATAGGRRP